MPSLVAETLRDLVSAWNVFIIGDPKGRELDERRLGPQEVDAARQVIATAALLVQAVQSSENIATPRAIEAVIEQADAATHTPTGIDGDQAIYLSQKTSGNFVIQILRSAYEPVRRQLASAWKESRAGFYHAAGESIFVAATCAIAHYSPAIISFVAKNADALKAFAEAASHSRRNYRPHSSPGVFLASNPDPQSPLRRKPQHGCHAG